VSEHVDLDLGSHAVAMLTVAAATPARREDLLSAVGLTNTYGNYKRNLVPLVEAGLLERTEPDSLRDASVRAFQRDAFTPTLNGAICLGISPAWLKTGDVPQRSDSVAFSIFDSPICHLTSHYTSEGYEIRIQGDG
jgi:hypothetical protein